jgi:hypothetical protein
MLNNIVIAHKQTCGVHDSRLKSHPLLLHPNNRSNLRHRHHNLRQGGLLRLHLETKFLAKWPQVASEELFNSTMDPNDSSSLDKSCNIGTSRTTFKCDSHRIVQQNHSTTQWVGPIIADVSRLLHGHPVREPVIIPPARPLVPHNRGKPQPTTKMIRVKSDATKLSGKGTFGTLKLNLLILIVQLVVLSEDICSRTTPIGSNNLDKLTDMDNIIWC